MPRGKTSKRARPPRRGSETLTDRLRLRDEFFSRTIAARQLLEPFENIPGLLYFVKDSKSRLMALSKHGLERMGFKKEEEIIGRSVHEYLPNDLADHYLASDQWVFENGKPLRNIVEIWFNEQGVRDWIVTNKYPLRNEAGKVVGLIGTIQSFEERRKMMAHLGPVGKAADFIRDHLGDSLALPDIARHAGFSERQLQRLFRRVFGMTVQQFIIQSRIHAAIQELTRSQRSVAEIAAMFGFSDQSAFSNKFRAATGLPPRAYRERYLAKFLS